MKRRDTSFYLRKAAQGIFVSLFFVVVLLAPGRDVIVAQMLLYETMPNYKIDTQIKTLLGLTPQAAESESVAVFSGEAESADNLVAEDIVPLVRQDESDGLIGLDDDIYRHEAGSADHVYSEVAAVETDVSKLGELSELRSKYYTVSKRTEMTAGDFDVTRFMDTDLSIDRDSEGPKVLVFHTHAAEAYADSVDESEGVMWLGKELCEILENKYGIKSMQDLTKHGMLDGRSDILGAYERMEPVVMKILEDNPSIELVIDLHRDGVAEGTRFVTDINGKPTAQLMFVNGLSKIYKDGALMAIESLPNPNLPTNLAMSFRMQLSANKLYPGLMRRIYIEGYRYSLNMMPKSLLVEVGAQTNTKAEALNAIEPLADILATVVLN